VPDVEDVKASHDKIADDTTEPVDDPDSPYWEKSTKWRFIAHWLTNHTTTHGVPSIARPDSQSMYRRVCWFLTFALSMVMLILQLQPIIEGHLDLQTGSVETRSFAPGLRGPAVTICRK
jgi:hypothetical protein